MGEVRHLQIDSLSALLDGELPGREAAAARAHLDACAACRADVASLARVDDELRLPPALSCDLAGPFLSAARDGEADSADAAIASRHLLACDACRETERSWAAVEHVLAGPLVLPSARVDAAMRALVDGTRAPRGTGAPRGLRPARVGPLGGLAWRGAVVAALALAIAFGSTIAPGAPDQAAVPGPEASLVAAVQQVVLHERTNTLYVAQPDTGAVNALDATTYALRARIVVGGRPTALALNDPANRIVVLDAVAKRLTEIDIARNAVVETTQLAVEGTPTSVQVENGKIAVFTAVAPKAPAAASAAPVAAAGQVAVFDSSTKQLETKQSVDVVPSLVVPDPTGGRTLLVSAQATTVADASYRTIQSLVGGVGAAFGSGDRIAVLSTEGTAARLTFYGERAPAAMRFDGIASAVIGLPDGGFAVLLNRDGRGRIVVVDASGETAGQVDLAVAGRGLAYDAAAKKFSVVGGGEISAASLPASVAQGPSRTAETPRASASPPPSPSPAASPSAPPAASPAPSASPAASRPPAASAPPAVAGVPAGALPVAVDLYRLPLADGRVPTLVATSAGRIWFVDQRNQLVSVDTATGATFTVAPFPGDARIGALAAGLADVYAVDTNKSRLFRFALKGERLTAHQLPFTGVSALTVAPDGTAWLAMPGTSLLLAFEPGSSRVEAIDIGVRGAIALAADIGGRVWFSDGGSHIGSYDRFANTVAQLAWPGGPTTPSVFLADTGGRVWAGTATGDIYFLTSGVANVAARVGRPISAFALDPSTGQPWYLAPALQQAGFVYAPVRGSQPARLVPGPASSLAIAVSGRAWLTDPSGGFYIGAAEAAR